MEHPCRHFTAGSRAINITIATIGKMKRDAPERALIEKYIAQSPWPVTIKEMESKQRDPVKRKAEESALLLKAGDGVSGLTRIALHEHGKTYRSQDFAALLGRLRDEGTSNLHFLIGGADGHSDALLEKCPKRLSLGAATWPHMLVRAMLAEQLYRAWSIQNNHPYHRE